MWWRTVCNDPLALLNVWQATSKRVSRCDLESPRASNAQSSLCGHSSRSRGENVNGVCVCGRRCRQPSRWFPHSPHTVEIDAEVIQKFIKKMSPKPVWGKKMRAEMIGGGALPEWRLLGVTHAHLANDYTHPLYWSRILITFKDYSRDIFHCNSCTV